MTVECRHADTESHGALAVIHATAHADRPLPGSIVITDLTRRQRTGDTSGGDPAILVDLTLKLCTHRVQIVLDTRHTRVEGANSRADIMIGTALNRVIRRTHSAGRRVERRAAAQRCRQTASQAVDLAAVDRVGRACREAACADIVQYDRPGARSGRQIGVVRRRRRIAWRGGARAVANGAERPGGDARRKRDNAARRRAQAR
jgi:hypothetical protein